MHMNFGKLCQINSFSQQIPTGDKYNSDVM